MYENFKKKFKGVKLRNEMWNASRALTESVFKYHMQIIKNIDKRAYEWLANVPPRLWSRHKFEDNSKCDLVVNNLAETWNVNIGDARDKPLITMLEWIRSYLMHRNQSRRQWIQNQTGLLCPTIATDLKNIMDDCRHCSTTKAGDDIFEVYYKGVNEGVNLSNRTCSCREWDVKGIPCIHAIACIISERGQPENYVDSFYHRETYFRTDYHIIYPMPLRNLQREVGTDPIHPPIVKPVTGRPKKIYKMKLMQEEEELVVIKLMKEEEELEVMKLMEEEDELEVVQKKEKLKVITIPSRYGTMLNNLRSSQPSSSLVDLNVLWSSQASSSSGRSVQLCSFIAVV
ncbi:uncharacterized protein LOC132272530 [Cornus florida]|uniref:uncharacterized protein LOC132272530 n=1 Tax=Cornus florida TaxID=4283 RepID=UPI0028968906|nr:uncharacterized protein LOC132272530 [Cornus florida]